MRIWRERLEVEEMPWSAGRQEKQPGSQQGGQARGKAPFIVIFLKDYFTGEGFFPHSMHFSSPPGLSSAFLKLRPGRGKSLKRSLS